MYRCRVLLAELRCIVHDMREGRHWEITVRNMSSYIAPRINFVIEKKVEQSKLNELNYEATLNRTINYQRLV